MSRLALPEEIVSSRAIAVFRGLPPDSASRVAIVLADAGIRVMEITMDSPEATESIAGIRETALVGAGTVMTIAEAEAAVAAGARFLVSPHTDGRVIRWAADRGIPMIAGAFTPTEVMNAWVSGSTAVKIFPASVGGPPMLTALLGPLGSIPLIATGGVTGENARSFLDAGATAVGLGGWLTGGSDLDIVERRARQTVEACRP